MGLKGPKSAKEQIGKQLSFEEIDTLFSEDQLLQLFDLYTASSEIPEPPISGSDELKGVKS